MHGFYEALNVSDILFLVVDDSYVLSRGGFNPRLHHKINDGRT